MKFRNRFHMASAFAFMAGLVFVIAASNQAAADEMIGFGKETLQLNLGYYRPNFRTYVADDSSGSPPANISGENDLNLANRFGGQRLDGYWRFADRHRIYFGYYELNRSESQVLGHDIGPINIPDIGVNDSILAGSNIKADTKWQVLILGYGYSFYKSDTVEVAGKFGLNIAKVGVQLHGTLITQNHGTLADSTAGSVMTVPLPALGFSGDWALSERWKLKGNVGGFQIAIDNVKATVVDAGAAAEYRVAKNFGVGAGYSLLNTRVEAERNHSSTSLDWRTGGWQFYGTLLF